MNAKQLGYDSDEELYFDWWLEELIGIGLVEERIYQPQSFVLAEKEKLSSITLREHIYTADYRIIWNNGNRYFTQLCQPINYVLNKNYLKNPIYFDGTQSWVEIKPVHIPHNMQRLFVLNQKWVRYRYKIYVQMIVPIILFEKTFYPVNYLALKRNVKNYKRINEYFK